uniref:POZ/BTB and AT hook containing zinc finger 1 n=1 Tax=Callorhinchus milii TaxID=7868 RepID=A0A4W3GT13_CALMI
MERAADQSWSSSYTYQVSQHSADMLKRLNGQRKSGGRFCDVLLRVGEESFPAHRAVLAACSDYFESVFGGQGEQAEARELEMHTISAKVFRDILEFAYTSKIVVRLETFPELMTAAKFLLMRSIIDICQEVIKQSNVQIMVPPPPPPARAADMMLFSRPTAAANGHGHGHGGSLPADIKLGGPGLGLGLGLGPNAGLGLGLGSSSSLQSPLPGAVDGLGLGSGSGLGHPQYQAAVAAAAAAAAAAAERGKVTKRGRGRPRKAVPAPAPLPVSVFELPVLSGAGPGPGPGPGREEGFYPCSFCGKVFKNANRLLLHEAQHTGLSLELGAADHQPGTGPGPGAGFGDHPLAACSGGPDTPRKRGRLRKNVACELCGKAFRDVYHLNRHKLSHSGEKPFECPICHQRFKRKDRMTYHIRSHDGAVGKPYICISCGKGFSR